MRKRTKIALGSLTAGVIVAGLVATQVSAHPGGRERGGPHGRMGWMGGAMLLDQIDADGNGSVDKAELDRFIDSAVQRADTDGDRQLSRDEFTKLLVEVTGPAQVRAFQFFDADGDGKVALNEVKKPADRFFDHHERDGRLEPMGGHRGRGPDGPPPPPPPRG